MKQIHKSTLIQVNSTCTSGCSLHFDLGSKKKKCCKKYKKEGKSPCKKCPKNLA